MPLSYPQQRRQMGPPGMSMPRPIYGQAPTAPRITVPTPGPRPEGPYGPRPGMPPITAPRPVPPSSQVPWEHPVPLPTGPAPNPYARPGQLPSQAPQPYPTSGFPIPPREFPNIPIAPSPYPNGIPTRPPLLPGASQGGYFPYNYGGQLSPYGAQLHPDDGHMSMLYNLINGQSGQLPFSYNPYLYR